MADVVETCSNCKFTAVDKTGIYCKRYPPVPFWDEALNSKQQQFPKITKDEWCGEWVVAKKV